MKIYKNENKIHRLILILTILYTSMLSAIAQDQQVDLNLDGFSGPYHSELSEDILQFKMTMWHDEPNDADPRPATEILVNWHIEGSDSLDGVWHDIVLTPTGPNEVREIIEDLYPFGMTEGTVPFPRTLYNHQDKPPGKDAFMLGEYNLLSQWHISQIPPNYVAALTIIIKTERMYKYYRQVVDNYVIIPPSSDII
ncbi:MAG: hypothetical protein WBN94_12155 [Methanothrix sp.]